MNEFEDRFPKVSRIPELAGEIEGGLRQSWADELEKIIDIVDKAYDDAPFSEGDYVRYTESSKLTKDHGWHCYQEQFSEATLRITEAHWNTGEYSSRGWRYLCRLTDFYPSYLDNEGPILELKKFFYMEGSALKKSSEAAHSEWVSLSKKRNTHRYNEKKRKENEKKKKCLRCNRDCDCK